MVVESGEPQRMAVLVERFSVETQVICPQTTDQDPVAGSERNLPS